MQRNKTKAAPAIDTRTSTKAFQQNRAEMVKAIEASAHGDSVRTLEAATAMSNLAYQIEQLEKVVDVLASRLQPVLAPKPTVGPAEESHAFSAPLFQAIGTQTERLKSINSHIEYLVGSLEV